MSLDGKEPGATWPNPQEQDSAVEQAHSLDANSVASEAQPEVQLDEQAVDHLPFTEGEIDSNYDEGYPYATDPDSEQFDQQAEPASNPSELVHQLWHYCTLILAPLLFGAVTSLFVLPLIATGHAQVPSTAFWPVALVIVLIAIAQGVAVYYSGTNNGMWAMGTIGGLFLFLLVGCFSIFGPLMGLTMLVVLIAAAVYLVRYYVRPVPEGMVEIVYTFGKYMRSLYPGPNVVFPWEKVKYTLNTKEVQWPCPPQRVQLSRNEDVILRAEISYQLLPEDASLAVTQVQDWEESLKSRLTTGLQTIATTFAPDDFLVWPQGLHAQRASYRDQHGMPSNGARWEQVNAALLQYMRDKVALWGVQINWVKIRDVSLAPHDAAIVDTEPVMNARNGEENAGKATAAVEKRPAAAIASETTTKMSGTEVAALSQEASGPAARPTNGKAAKGVLREDILVQAYTAVQNGKITDPETIRGLAEKFELVAQDPELNEKVSFDPARAAQNLHNQAKRWEELYESGGGIYSDETKPDWLVRRPTDENLTGGG
jgi:regulator of protease activity HflC (stomatin/prohibitin superfamily)